ncbi:hypothetical protein [Streptomyces halobius]|uniref:Uncharacterized protein n=1 Tax=Streptomyces halobius TaxID=2879846 RepID=A0ABY4M2C3_9ACTN|nr:hypothetical protein [Streptomyces halobius]UQA91612.1 hypothetical protein K9S39_06850 [Streptomyces halobius]
MAAVPLPPLPREPLQVQCTTCEKVYIFDVSPEDFFDFKRGKFAQDAFPYLTNDERELMISRTCGGCFDAMFPETD